MPVLSATQTDAPSSLVELLGRRALSQAERLAYVFLKNGEEEAERLTCGELDRRARALGAMLASRGLRGERVLLLFPPGLEFVTAFFGGLYAGAVVVPAYPPGRSRHLQRLQSIAADARPRMILTSAAIVSRIESWAAATPELADVEIVDAGTVDAAWAGELRRPAIAASEVAFLQYTSGSTSAPRGVLITHANLLHNEEMIRRGFDQTADSVIVSWLPLYHDMGLIGGVLQPLYVGARCILMSPTAFLQQPARWLRAIGRYRATTSGGPNFAYDLCVRNVREEDRADLDLSSWRVAFNGSEPVRSATLQRFADAFHGCGFQPRSFLPCYGLAEATLFVAGAAVGAGPAVESVSAAALQAGKVAPAEDGGASQALVGCGRLAPGQRIVIADPRTGRRAAPDRVGEIWVTGPSVAGGYWNHDGASAETFGARLAGERTAVRYLRTGDLGFLRGGELFVTGRRKDLIIVRGRNHYPQDVELAAEKAHPALRPGCGAAFAVETDGEERLVVAFEVERHGSADPDEVTAAVRRSVLEEQEIAAHDVVLVRAGTIPRTSSGKVRRHACREAYLAGTLAIVGRSRRAPEPEQVFTASERGGSADEMRRRDVEELIWREAARSARWAGAFDAALSLTDLGLDSLGVVELQQSLEQKLRTSISLALLLEAASIEALASRVLELLERGEETRTPALRASVGEHDGQPLSHGQEALWYLHRLAPASAVYNIAVAARVAAALDAAALGRAARALVRRHAELRAFFPAPEGKPVRRLASEPEPELRNEDAAGWSEEELEERCHRAAYRPFDLRTGPLLRLAVFTRSATDHILVVAVHHIVADFWSMAVLARELGALYDAERGGPAAALGPLPVTYGDYAAWQRRRLEGADGERLWAYWRRRLAGDLPDLAVPTDRPRPPQPSYRGAARARRLGEAAAGFRSLARENETTAFMTLLATFQVLLGRISGQDDVLVGTPTANRGAADVAGLVGYFVNPVVLRADLSSDPSFATFFAGVRRTTLDAFEHQDFPFSLLAARLQPQRQAGRSSLFRAMFVMQSPPPGGEEALSAFALKLPGGRLTLPGLELESMALAERYAPFDLTLRAAPLAGGWTVSLQYDADVFDDATAGRLLSQFETLLAAAAREPRRRLSTLPLLSAAEAAQLAEWGETPAPALAGGLLHARFERQAARFPQATALVCGRETLSYGELDRRATLLARRLARRGVGPEDRVGVFAARGADLVIALLAVLKAGAAYVPLDPAYPEQRLTFMARDAGLAAVLADSGLCARAEVLAPAVVELVPHGGGKEDHPLPAASERNLAYVIYTSGSTGRPKGVAIEHRSAAAFLQWARRPFSDGELSGVLAATSVCFDLSVFELFVPLSWGGTVVLAADVLELPRTQGVRLLNTVPSALRELLRLGELPDSVLTVNLAGEPLRRALVDDIPGHLRVLNLYGPSEDTTYSTWTQVHRGAGEPTIGRPVDHTQAYVLDRRLRRAPAGVRGELYLGGAGLARGYLGRASRTAESFLPDPFAARPGQRIYRTRDVVDWRPDGDLAFHGRSDHQVKLRGFRIELGEIETVLADHPDVREAAVAVRSFAPDDPRLVAYLAAARVDETELRSYLRRRLPEHMVPAAFVVVGALPLSPNGKVDRAALPAPARGDAAAAPPRTPLEAVVAQVWAEALGGGPVGVDDDFFALGGHSLLLARVQHRLGEIVGARPTLHDLLRHPTVGSCARFLSTAADRPQAPLLRRVCDRLSAPLSFAQERLGFLHRLDPHDCAYNVLNAVRLKGSLRRDVLGPCLGEVVRRQESLRTTFLLAADPPIQVVAPRFDLPLPEIDLRRLPAARREPVVRALAAQESRRPFDLERGALLRLRLLRTGEAEHVLVLCQHHVITDGWSLGVIVRELGELYRAACAGGRPALPELPVRYRDYAVWQRRWLAGEALNDVLAYWQRQLAGAPTVLELPADRQRPAFASHRGASCAVVMAPALRAAVEKLGQRYQATPFMVLLTAFQLLLHRYTGRRDIVVGTPVAGRPWQALEGLVGFFVNTLVLRTDFAGASTGAEALERGRTTALQALAHQEAPFEKLVEKLAPERSPGRLPLAQVMFAFQNAPLPALDMPGLQAEILDLPESTSLTDLALEIRAEERTWRARIRYSTDLFDATSAARLAGHFLRLLDGLLATPEGPFATLPLLAPAQCHQLHAEWNATAADAPWPRCVPQLFAQSAEERPDALALAAGGEHLSYGELDVRAQRLARRLGEAGVGPEVPAAICLERSPRLVVAMLGVLKAGGAYVPLDVAYPEERLAFMLADLVRAHPATVLITSREISGILPEAGVPRIELDVVEKELARHDAVPAGRRAGDHLAYVIYTSGSTGRPKGVGVTHSGLANLVAWHRDTYAVSAGDRATQVASPAFDASVWEIWPYLCAGASLHLPDEETRASAVRLLAWLARERIHLSFLPTPLAESALAESAPVGLALRALLTGGDRLHRTVRTPPFDLVNHYGPTEATVVATWGRVEPRGRREPTLGRVIAHTRIYVVDRALERVPIGVPGELCIAGRSLARGYLRRPGLTGERFIPDPAGDPAGGRLYRTGDLVRQLAGGELDFLGRLDHQVKLRGFRIELGEVEASLGTHPEVRAAVVVSRSDAPGGPRLVAYVAAARVDEGELRAFLRRRLPEHMVPAAFVVVGALPLTPNGKVDRAALPAPALNGAAGTAPRTPLEEVVAQVWAEVLGGGPVGLGEDFFALGGHSLLATRMTSRLRQVLGVEVPVRQVFENPTVERLAAALDTRPATAAPIAPRPREAELALSFAQERLWFLDQLDPGSAAYNLAGALDVDGPLAVGVLARGLAEVVRRHETLRTVFVLERGEPRQEIRAPGEVLLPVIDLASMAGERRAALAEQWLRHEARRPFDLARGPLLRALLLRLGGERHVLLVTMHHVVSDGWSVNVLLHELTALYAGWPLPALSVQYADFALWQRRRLRGELLAGLMGYWRRQLAGVPAALDLPADRPRPAVRSGRGGRLAWRLPPASTGVLGELGREHGTTLFMTLVAAFQALLHRHSGQDALVVGSPIAHRTRAEIEPLIGFFVNTLALAADLGGDPAFTEHLARVRETTLGAYAHQDMPFEKLVGELAPQRDLGRAALFQVMLVLHNAARERFELGPARLRLREVDTGTAKFDLTLALAEVESELVGSWEYDADLFDVATVRRLAGHFETLLAAAAREPHRRLSALPLLSAAEAAQLAEWGETPAPALEDGLLHARFERQAARRPQATALVCGREAVTYGELDRRARLLARRLARRGVGPEDRVGVFAARGVDLVAALLAVLKAGGAYVPLDPAYPEQRLRFMARDAGLAVVVTDAGLRPRAEALAPAVVELAPHAGAVDDGPLPAAASERNLTYVIYTSGSTGRPKGVAIEHRSAATLVQWARRVFSDHELAGVLAATSVCFDLSIFELFVPLSWGGTVVLAQDALELMRTQGVRLLNTVPSALRELLRLGELPDSVLTVNLAGEPLRRALVDDVPACLRVLNLYGPSEDTTYSTWTQVPRGAGEPTIGRPVDHTRAYVLDRRLRRVPAGVRGELFLGGAGLARGYLARPALSAAAFLPDPFGASPGARIYRTRDVIAWRADGRLVFHGRSDHQVKLRGFRIELGEIEAVLASHPDVREAAVAVRAFAPDDSRLVAYLAAGAVEEGELRSFLRRRLPEHMVPAAFVVLDALPLTPNGKVDRAALPAPAREHGTAAAPRTPFEEVVAQVWAEVLGGGPIGVGDDFFELGGHSLLATRMTSRLRQVLGVEVPVRQVFENPTVERLAAVLDTRPATAAPIAPRPREAELPLSFAQERLWLLDQLDPGSAAYNVAGAVDVDGPLTVDVLARSLAEVVRRHETLRTVFVLERGEPRQEIRTPGEVPLPAIDLAAIAAERRAAIAEQWLRREARRPFDLSRGPLLRALLLRLGRDRHVLLVTMHHVVSDGWSVNVLLRELTALYAGRPLPALSVQYADFALWQRRRLDGELLAGLMGYWRRQLAGVPAALDLPTDRPRPAVRSGRGQRLPWRLPAAAASALRGLCREHGTTLFMTLLAAFQALLHRHSGQDALVVGSPIAHRTRAEIEPLIGFFVNTLALAAELGGDPAFAEHLARVRETTLGAYAHQDMPFEKLVGELAPQRELGRGALFQVMLVLQNAARERLELGAARLELREVDTGTAKFDLTLALAEVEGELVGSWEYDADLFDSATVRRLAGHFETLLAAAAREPHCRSSALPLLTAAEAAQLAEWGETPAPALEGGLLHARFERQAARHPEATALVRGRETLSYGELDRRATLLARRLARRGVGPEERVGVFALRTADLVAALLAVLKAGAAYVPLDPAYPEQRLTFMARDAGLAAVLTDSDLRARAAALAPAVVELAPPAGGAQDDPPLPAAASERNLAYVIYTSGSTGRPKGVAIEHRSAAALLQWARRVFSDHELAGVLAATSVCFDLSVFELFAPLSWGGTVVLSGDALELPRAHGVRLLNTVPSALRELLRLGELPDSVLTVNLAGEPLRRALVDDVPGHLRVLNLYGPSEDTTYSAWVEVPRGADEPTIGRPVDHTRAYVLDCRLRRAPAGVRGELYLGGAGLARGYLGRPRQSAASFLPDPFAHLPGDRIYRTRDLVHWRADGELVFHGRSDHQVKLRGFRIELGEVETVLATHPAVREAAVAVRAFAPDDQRLVAYVAAAGVDEAELRSFLRQRLPEHMVPAAFVVVGALPLSPNGKVDRAALAQRDLPWARRAGLRDRSFRPPATAAEVAVAAVWSDTLGNEHIGLDDSFFDLGGHSLLAIRMLSDLQDALPVEIPLRGLFESPTLEGFARRVEEQLDDAELTAMAALLREMEGLSEAEAAAPANHVEDFRRCSP